MTREEFLQRLDKALLAQVTEEERTEAIQFYEEYFSEAGPEQEEAVLAELGSPEKVAAIIKANAVSYTHLYHENMEKNHKNGRSVRPPTQGNEGLI